MTGSGDGADIPATIVARLAADEATARRMADALAENLDPEHVAASVFEDGAVWVVEIHAADEARIRALIETALGPRHVAAFTLQPLAARDWVRSSLEGLSPVEVGRFIVHGAHDRGRVAPNRIGIEIEAALAFGTGHHGTTRGCLVAFADLARRRSPRRLLDVGTGSGVLAIAAALSLRRPVLASDIDVIAVAAAARNARRNRAGSLVEPLHAPDLAARRFREHAPYDLIFANILLAPLRRLARPLAQLLVPGGRVILSGLLPSHAMAALSAYRMQGLALERRRDLDGWTTLVLCRPSRRPRPKQKRRPDPCRSAAPLKLSVANGVTRFSRARERRVIGLRSCS